MQTAQDEVHVRDSDHSGGGLIEKLRKNKEKRYKFNLADTNVFKCKASVTPECDLSNIHYCNICTS